ncbi:efflux RND transporter permease subunit [Salibacterium salarium]|uniref:Efflux RND transporter permease subunit n=1 Tax=Salibacterium salarium TaxID=284579 RepID=A0A3R9P0B0_9BACI|nr:efflux RND transporter permease subunit [Salibacterium salarium]RSL30081.1 efflux RND transporter permease subunit [Salibacterium salarium]
MNWIKVLLRRKFIVVYAIIGMVVVSMMFMDTLENQFYPEVTYDTVTVSAEASNVPASDMEENVTVPIEEALSNVEGIQGYESVSTDDLSSITVTLQEEVGDDAYEQLKNTVGEVEGSISTVHDIEISRNTSAQRYEFYMDIHDGDIGTMTTFGETTLKPRLESLQEVKEVRVVGQMERTVMVQLEPEQMNQAGVTYDDVENVLQQQNDNVSIGRSNEEDTPLLTWNTSLQDMEEIENLLIPAENGVVLLSTIADIKVEESRNNQELWRDGDNNYVWVSVGRTNEATQAELTHAVRSELKAIEQEGNIDGFVLDETIVQSDFVENSIGNLQTNVLIGGFLVVLVLFLFLRNVAATVIMAISIPVTVLMTFLLMALFDFSINLISLLGIGIGLGMVVDSSIVIMESIYKKKERGLDDREATIQGTKEVFTPVIASTLTTIMVFLPIGLISGQVGEFAKVIAAVIVFSQLSALIICFTFIPVMSEKWLKVKQKKESSKPSAFFAKIDRYIDWMGQKTRRKVGIVLLFFLVFLASLSLTFFTPVTVLPDFYDRQAEFYVGLEQQTTLEDRERVAESMSQFLSETEDIEGYNTRNFGQNQMYLYVKMTPEEEATVSQNEINSVIHDELQEMSKDHPITASGSVTYPIQISIKGDDLDELRGLADGLGAELADISGIQGITSTFENSRDEQRIVVDRSSAAMDGLTPTDIKDELTLLSTIRETGTIKAEGFSIPVMLSYGKEIQDATSLEEVEINTNNGEKPLSDYITFEEALSPNEIAHEDGERVIQLLGDVDGRDLSEVSDDIYQVVNNYRVEPGYSVEVGGQIADQETTSHEMYLVLLSAILLVFAIMSIQFNSLIHPFVVMSVIPLTLTGVLAGLFVTQTDLNLLSAMGMLILIGIVVNNGILLIDRMKQLRIAGMERYDAMKKACKERYRPIFITFITTVSATIPLAITTGHAGQYQQPMAIALIFGLSFSIFITLMFLPVAYVLFEDIAQKMKDRFYKR